MKIGRLEPLFSILLLPLLFFATFLWANFAAMPMMNDCEKSARHLWLLWLMNMKMAVVSITKSAKYSNYSKDSQTMYSNFTLSGALISQGQQGFED